MKDKTYFTSRLSLAIIFFYHGLVPKLIFRNEQEVLMNDTLMPFVEKDLALNSSGILEIILAIALMILYRNKILLYLIIFFATSVTLALIIKLPGLFENAFNPFSLNLAVLVLCLINLFQHEKQFKGESQG